MSTHDSFGAGALAGMLFAVGAQALHWFIAPVAHPGATTARTTAVALQAVLGFGAAGWLAWRARRMRIGTDAPAA